MARIICDSDDEGGDFESDDVINVSPAKPGQNASTPHDGEHAAGQPQPNSAAGTGSTESLKRAIETAHRNLIGTESTRSSQNGGHKSSASPSMRECKRRKTETDVTMRPDAPKKKPERRKTVKTYGRSKFLPDELIMKESGEENETASTTKSQPKSSANGHLLNSPWNAPLQDFAQHEPAVLFGDASSTVPNTTATQQRLLDEVLNPHFLDTTFFTGPSEIRQEPLPQPSEGSSLPWSTYISLPSSRVDVLSKSSGSKDGSNGTQVPANPPDSVGTSQADELEKSRPIVEPLSPLAGAADELTTDQPFPIVTKQETRVPLASQDTSCDEISLVSDRPSKRQKTSKESVPQDAVGRRKLDAKNNISSDIPNSDDLTIGLPKERYKARPSRSRTSHLPEDESIDYSIRPEKAAKARTKRSKTLNITNDEGERPTRKRKTTDLAVASSGKSTNSERSLREVADSNTVSLANVPVKENVDGVRAEVSPHEPKVQIKKNMKDVPATVGNGSALPKTQKSPLPAAHPATSPSVEVDQQATAITGGTEAISRDQSMVLKLDAAKSPSATPVSSRAKKKRGVTMGGRLENISVPEEPPKSVEQPAKQKKRGRGRPRKESKPTEESKAQEHQSGVPYPSTDLKVADYDDTSDTVLEEQDTKDAEGMALSSSQTTATKPKNKLKPLDLPDVPENRSPSPVKQTNAEPTSTPEKQKKASSPAHSPLSKGKVAYRVGLSKRTRIAPLLKMVRK